MNKKRKFRPASPEPLEDRRVPSLGGPRLAAAFRPAGPPPAAPSSASLVSLGGSLSGTAQAFPIPQRGITDLYLSGTGTVSPLGQSSVNGTLVFSPPIPTGFATGISGDLTLSNRRGLVVLHVDRPGPPPAFPVPFPLKVVLPYTITGGTASLKGLAGTGLAELTLTSIGRPGNPRTGIRGSFTLVPASPGVFA